MNHETITFEAPLLRGRFIVFSEPPEIEVIRLKQIHSDITLHEDDCSLRAEGDGIVGESQTPKAILTADCLPIVLLSKNQHSVIHAGWKGLANEILLSSVIKKMNPIYAFIGPHIRKSQYEVQADFKKNFAKHLNAFEVINQKLYFDMSQVAKEQLKNSYPQIVIEDCELCTLSEDKFHSFRRDQTTKRNWNVYVP